MRSIGSIDRYVHELTSSQPWSDRMATSVVPPSRKSIRHIGEVNPCGPHHVMTSSGSLHARQTRSRGASIVRVTTMSWVSRWSDIVITSVRGFAPYARRRPPMSYGTLIVSSAPGFGRHPPPKLWPSSVKRPVNVASSGP